MSKQFVKTNDFRSVARGEVAVAERDVVGRDVAGRSVAAGDVLIDRIDRTLVERYDEAPS